MTRPIQFRRAAFLLAGALCLTAQSGRDAYRNAYRAWREADPNLESDAGKDGDALSARTSKAAELAGTYMTAHGTELRNMADQQEQNLEWLRSNVTRSLPDLSPAGDTLRFVSRQANSTRATAAGFANDPDRAIQQLRQALQREQEALEGLRTAIMDRQETEDKGIRTVSSAELARVKAVEEFTFLTVPLSQTATLMTQEGSLWATYYPRLAAAARNASTVLPPATNLPSPAPLTSAEGLSPAAPKPSITPLPLSRYTGVWSWKPGGIFFGTEPEVIDLAVHEENGHATGTFYGRFKLPQGSTGDPVLRFELSGDFTATRIQTFSLITADGVIGIVQLIPGGPFNMLEVNFNTEVRPGKIHQGDVLLQKQ